MLRTDDYESGFGLNRHQQEYHREMSKLPYESVLRCSAFRQHVAKAIFPATHEGVANAILSNPYVRSRDVLFAIMRDHCSQGTARGVMAVHSFHLADGSTPTIGGDPDHCVAVFDYFKKPQLPGAQIGLSVSNGDDQVWAWSDRAKLVAVRRGPYLDIVAPKPEMDAFKDVIIWRFNYEDVLLKRIGVRADGDVIGMAEGEQLALGEFSRGDTVVAIRAADVTYKQGWFENGVAARVDDDPAMLPADDEMLMGLANTMNSQIAEYEFIAKRFRKPLCSPAYYRVHAYAPFTYQQLDSISSLEGFYCTPRLKHDLAAALGPFGTFQMLSNYTGRIKDISQDAASGGVVLTFLPEEGRPADNREACQMFPPTVVLKRPDGGGLTIGDRVTRGQKIGTVLPRKDRSWDSISDEIGEHFMRYVVDLFLYYKAIRRGRHAWNGNGILLNVEYVYPILHHALQFQGEPDIYLDIRKLKQFYDSEKSAIFLPVHYTRSHNGVFDVYGMKYVAGEPASAVPAAEPVDLASDQSNDVESPALAM